MGSRKPDASILADPRYPAFVERYAFDSCRFAIEVCGLKPTWQQVELFDSVTPPGSRTSVSSGHGTGKTASFGVLGLWHLSCYKRSNTILTAPRIDTVRSGVWKEFAGLRASIESGPHAWIIDYIVIETEKVYIRGFKLDWWIVGKTAPVGRPENIAGAHNDWLMWLCDESSGIPDKNFGVIGGSLTDARNRMVMASQPTRPSGFFYDSHNSLSVENGGVWNNLTFNSEDSPLVSDSFIREKLLEYGGSDSAEYQIKVQGQFPENGEGYLIGRKAIEQVIGAPRRIGDHEPWGHMLIIDVGAGVHRDYTVGSHFHVIGNGDRLDDDPRRVDLVDIPIYSNSLDWPEVARRATDYALALPNCTVLVDVGGQGVQFAKMMEQMGAPNVVHINWGEYNWKKRLKERFFNRRAQCSVQAVEAVKDGRLSLIDAHKKEMLDQGSRIPYHIDELGRWHIATKEQMKRDGLPSPDLWDTICMAFLEDASYIPSGGQGQLQGGAPADEVAEADDLVGRLLSNG
jgi:hypothetical protein